MYIDTVVLSAFLYLTTQLSSGYKLSLQGNLSRSNTINATSTTWPVKSRHGHPSSRSTTPSYSSKARRTGLRSTVPIVRPTLTPEQIGRNITIILENLLQNYDSSQRPGYETGQITTVYSNIVVRSMGPISELGMDFSMDCYFRQVWDDQRLSFHGPIEVLSLSIKMLEGIWKPDTFFYNGKKSYVHTITQPNKLLRITRDGRILYSVRLTIKAKCPMELRNFPMDRQSCPLVIGSYAYTSDELLYHWNSSNAVVFLGGIELSQFDLISSPYRDGTILQRRQGNFSVLQVSFNLRRNQGYFLIQIYIPCVLIVVLSWVSFWLNREATSDRVSLGITSVLTLSTISVDSRNDLPKVHYATALDWFLLMSFAYCISTLLEFAGVHFFTKVGSGEGTEEFVNATSSRSSSSSSGSDDELPLRYDTPPSNDIPPLPRRVTTQTSSANNIAHAPGTPPSYASPRERESCCHQFLNCLSGNQAYRRRRHRLALQRGSVNSVSQIDKAARILFPFTFVLFNLFYWWSYARTVDDFSWSKIDQMRFY